MKPEHPAEAGASLELRRLRKRFGAQDVVKSVDLCIKPGEFVTLLGPSGSGKTTTLNMIAGFEQPTGGEILADGKPISDLPTHRRNIGMVFQSYALFPHMTAAQNIAFPLRQRRVPKPEAEARVREALALVHLEKFADRYPKALSGGQQQRVALARAVVFNPRILLMDEPLGALDKKLREALQTEIRRIHRELGVTVVFVTHDQEEALTLSDRIAVFNDGRIEQAATAEELYERPATRFVADFLGDSNIFTGPAHAVGGTTTVAVGDARIRVPLIASATGAARVVGATGCVLVRPERCRVTASATDAPESHNRLSGTVCDVVYLGSARRIDVDVPGHGRMSVREPAAGSEDVRPGDSVAVHWPLDAGALLAGSPSDAEPEPETAPGEESVPRAAEANA
ncbi:ABC transporter ATP-binding protein [Streptomyces sp. DSM 3412]|uniref:Spermidine/putrescine import ATP-binding protein PotA n=1 Tax=Streptomyces gottesmaniae TaxID=3075518 RepID=A0ABU2Z1W2_9ACTN|nr:ABC transporter ATP-binding protein [Streptomyces sp. DSM 3412]MDT0570259.1 ABC transporter ATP-binding protein [Streptomyces sp. DSM 3412]